jgi:hypothetical protein
MVIGMCESRLLKVICAEKFGVNDIGVYSFSYKILVLLGAMLVFIGIISIFDTAGNRGMVIKLLAFSLIGVGIISFVYAYVLYKSYHWKQELPQCIINRGWRTISKMPDDDYKRKLNDIIPTADFTMTAEQSDKLKEWLDKYDELQEIKTELIP